MALLLFSTSTEMKFVTLYMSSHTLSFLEATDSGEYVCTMNFRSGIEVSASTKFNITIGNDFMVDLMFVTDTCKTIYIVDVMFQLRLKSVDICQWHHNQVGRLSD